jgi:hypothetical protein
LNRDHNDHHALSSESESCQCHWHGSDDSADHALAGQY